MTVAVIGIAIVLALVFLRVPIAIAMGLVGAVGFAMLNGWRWQASLSPAAGTIIDAAQSESLSVIPLFLLMGLVVARAGFASDLYGASHAFLGHRRGGLAMATIVACGGFSAICGSSLATAATMSKVAMPEMRRFGYADSLSSASIAAGGTLGILIPPSVILIIYGIMTQTSISALFLAGIAPGLLGILLYLGAVQFVVWRNPDAGPAVEREGWRERFRKLMLVAPILALFVLILGGIYLNSLTGTGGFTTTEAAGMGAGFSILIAVGFNIFAPGESRFTLAGLWEAMKETAITTASLFAILIGATIFERFVSRAGLPSGLNEFITSAHLEPWLVILVILLIYLALGCVLESLSMIVLTVPVFLPIITELPLMAGDLDRVKIWFGILVVVVTEISLITPPIGLNVFVLRGVLGDITTGTIFRGVTPFWCADIVRLALIALIPALSLGIPFAFNP